MQRWPRDSLLFVVLLCLITIIQPATISESGRRRRYSPVSIPVGVILDPDSSLGSMANSCINIGLQDFYSTLEDYYTTNLTLHFRLSGKTLLTAASAGRDLIENEKVHAILGPQNSEQARFIVELGNKSNVPVIWFSPSGPSLLPPRSRFFVHSNSSRSHCSQFEAIAAIIKAYNWQSVIPIYEDPEFGNDLIPCLSYVLQDMDTRVPYISVMRQNFSDQNITEELNKIKGNRTYVFIAHMTVELWSRLLKHAQKQGLMSEEYAWILTQGLSSVLSPEALDIKAKGYMDGALGVRPSLVGSNITKRISLATTLMSKYDKTLSLYGLWAYDTITALAYAVENNGLEYFNESGVDLRNETGTDLRKAIQETNLHGLSGIFSLRQGQLEPSHIVVYNVKGKREVTIGQWSPEKGLKLIKNYTGDELIWPGNTTERQAKLKVGVPKTYFIEFINGSGEGAIGGFAVDVFKRVVEVLHLSYDFVPVNISGEENPSSYDDLLCVIKDKNVDLIIGDITIVASRTRCVDFTAPYLDSTVSMVVKVRSDSKNGWILLKPFDWLLWLILGMFFVCATVIVIILERRKKDVAESKFKHFARNPFLIYMSDIKSLKSGTSKWLVIVVMFVLGIAVQVYTANLTSILTERTTAKDSPWKDLQEIKRNNRFVGYQNNSWVKELLKNQMGLNEERLKPLESRKDYKEKLLSKGGVDAIFDEIPYLMLLLSECPSCKMIGPIYKTGGFAFAFPKNSTLVSSFSGAILNVTQNVITFRDMKINASLPVTIERSEYNSDVEIRGLTKDDFGGLFPIVYSVLALFFTISVLKAKWFQDKWIPFC